MHCLCLPPAPLIFGNTDSAISHEIVFGYRFPCSEPIVSVCFQFWNVMLRLKNKRHTVFLFSSPIIIPSLLNNIGTECTSICLFVRGCSNVHVAELCNENVRGKLCSLKSDRGFRKNHDKMATEFNFLPF